MSSTKRKLVRSTKKQLRMLLDYMSNSKEFANGEYTGPMGYRNHMKEWDLLQKHLNEAGPEKSVDQWRNTWRDMKKRAREEGAQVKRARAQTGNKPVPDLSDQAQLVLEIIGTQCAIGIGDSETGIGELIFETDLVSPPPQHEDHSFLTVASIHHTQSPSPDNSPVSSHLPKTLPHTQIASIQPSKSISHTDTQATYSPVSNYILEKSPHTLASSSSTSHTQGFNSPVSIKSIQIISKAQPFSSKTSRIPAPTFNSPVSIEPVSQTPPSITRTSQIEAPTYHSPVSIEPISQTVTSNTPTSQIQAATYHSPVSIEPISKTPPSNTTTSQIQAPTYHSPVTILTQPSSSNSLGTNQSERRRPKNTANEFLQSEKMTREVLMGISNQLKIQTQQLLLKNRWEHQKSLEKASVTPVSTALHSLSTALIEPQTSTSKHFNPAIDQNDSCEDLITLSDLDDSVADSDYKPDSSDGNSSSDDSEQESHSLRNLLMLPERAYDDPCPALIPIDTIITNVFVAQYPGPIYFNGTSSAVSDEGVTQEFAVTDERVTEESAEADERVTQESNRVFVVDSAGHVFIIVLVIVF